MKAIYYIPALIVVLIFLACEKGRAWLGTEGPGRARRGMDWRGFARQGRARHGKARQGN